MVLRLILCSPRRRIRLVTVIRGYGLSKPGRARKTSANLTPATGARTTRLCRTPQRRSSVAPVVRSQTGVSPAIPCAPDAAASTASHPNVLDDPDTPLVAGRDDEASRTDLGRRKQEYFWIRDWTGRWCDLPDGQPNQLWW